MLARAFLMALALHQFDTDAVGRCDITQQSRVVKKLEAIFRTAVIPGVILVSPASLWVLKRVVYRKSFSCSRR